MDGSWHWQLVDKARLLKPFTFPSYQSGFDITTRCVQVLMHGTVVRHFEAVIIQWYRQFQYWPSLKGMAQWLWLFIALMIMQMNNMDKKTGSHVGLHCTSYSMFHFFSCGWKPLLLDLLSLSLSLFFLVIMLLNVKRLGTQWSKSYMYPSCRFIYLLL